MEFVFLISSSRIGGAQYYVKRNAEFVSKLYKASIIYGKNEGNVFKTKENLAIGTINGLHIPFNPVAIFLLIRKFSRQQDIHFICNSFAAGVNGRVAALFLGVPSVYISHGWSYQYKSSFSRAIAYWTERILGKIGYTICISEADMRAAINHLRVKRKNIFLVRNRLFASLNQSPGGTIQKDQVLEKVVYVGRKEIPKRIDLYINLAESNPQISFHLVGVEKDEIEYYPSNLVVLGKIADFSGYAGYDLFCLFSDSEGLPLSAIEAAAAGVPVLLSDVGGCGELIRYKNGKITSNSDRSILENFREMMHHYASYRQRAETYRWKFIYNDLDEAVNKRVLSLFLSRIK